MSDLEALVRGSGGAVERARQIRLGQRLGQGFPQDAGGPIRNAVLLHELAVIELWDYAFDGSEASREQKARFHTLCGDCLDLLKALPEPQDRSEQILHRLKMISYAYLAERWEEAKEAARDVPERPGAWRDRVFESIFSAFLSLARKDGLADLESASAGIAQLRREQKSMEGPYLDGVDAEYGRGAAHELASLYHLAACVETAVEYMRSGSPPNVHVVLDMQFDKAVSHCQWSGQKDLEVVERMLHLVFKKMAENSVWSVASRMAHVKEFVDASLESSRPVFEFLYPQRAAVMHRGLLDPASRAAIVSMPTSSGKTLMAQLRIIQAIKQDPKSWAAYVAPTRTLVNQMAGRLRQDLRALDIRVEKMSGALDLDSFEQSMAGSARDFDVLVLTPEKMSLLIRRYGDLAKSLSLAVIDEAHNLTDAGRGLNLEMLLATIKNDCKAGLLLLTPFLSNAEQVARWLDPASPKIIAEDLGWRSGDSVVGLCYPKGEARDVSVHFRPLLHLPSVGTRAKPPKRKEFEIGGAPARMYTASRAKTKYVTAAIAAARLAEKGNVLVINRTVDGTWKTAAELEKMMPELDGPDERLSLVKKFVGAELGGAFPLARYLDRGIGVHNAGLPDEIRQLVEFLMGEGLLKALVSTTTTAQGVDFPVSAVLLASYWHPRSRMQPQEFWNIAGRTGRVGQRGMGLVGIATDGSPAEARKAAKFARQKALDAASAVEGLIGQAMRESGALDLHALAGDPQWSGFVQYLAHMYVQAGDLDNFIAGIELSLRNTYVYHRMEDAEQRALIDAVDRYGRRLDERGEFPRLSDLTGFSPETVESLAGRIKALGITESDWSGPGLFSGSRLPAMMKELMEGAPELKGLSDVKASQKTLGHDALARIVSDWVSGKSIPDISTAYFGGAGVGQIRDCVDAISRKISHYATWGLSAMHRVYRAGSGSSGASNLPAMVYYGVNTDEAVLMRMNSVPRSVSAAMGGAYKDERRDIHEAKPREVRGWLEDVDSPWNSAARPGARMSGAEYKQVWRQLAGLE